MILIIKWQQQLIDSQAKTWLTAESVSVHTSHRYNTVSEVNTDHVITGAISTKELCSQPGCQAKNASYP